MPTTISELINEVGHENVRFQYLTDCLASITQKKKYCEVAFATDAIDPYDAINPDGAKNVGNPVWIQKDKFDQAIAKLKRPDGRS